MILQGLIDMVVKDGIATRLVAGHRWGSQVVKSASHLLQYWRATKRLTSQYCSFA